jgi:sigma-E factor negative regulatory protein RseA
MIGSVTVNIQTRVKQESFMTQHQENLSAFVDGEHQGDDSALVDALKQDVELQDKWRRYHTIRDGLRGELPADMSVDIANSIAAAIADEPAIVAPKRRLRDLPVVGSVIPLVKQSGQFLVAASVAAVAILGVQNYNTTPEVNEPLMTAPPIAGRPQGGLAPVSLEQTRPVDRTDMATLLEQRRQINALIADHERQLQLKQAQMQDSTVQEQSAEQEQQPE